MAVFRVPFSYATLQTFRLASASSATHPRAGADRRRTAAGAPPLLAPLRLDQGPPPSGPVWARLAPRYRRHTAHRHGRRSPLALAGGCRPPGRPSAALGPADSQPRVAVLVVNASLTRPRATPRPRRPAPRLCGTGSLPPAPWCRSRTRRRRTRQGRSCPVPGKTSTRPPRGWPPCRCVARTPARSLSACQLLPPPWCSTARRRCAPPPAAAARPARAGTPRRKPASPPWPPWLPVRSPRPPGRPCTWTAPTLTKEACTPGPPTPCRPLATRTAKFMMATTARA